ncbi:hypothetical protein Bpfe_015936 [Biomphalaria pfeifferi]|uniref:Chitin-binding type-2 domain-containing protein n=1 Tax=Biomphalaria pfeifferi TaxID=112525 RepID=A0AAD8F8S4_BIOPF|nr:hypothetical protein Bpfe_015936 [Biomphalaria pfeifferi]
MATSTLLALMMAMVVIYTCEGRGTRFLIGLDANYNKLCNSSNEVNSVVGLPESECEQESFCICFNKEAYAIMSCRVGSRFDPKDGFCKSESEVPLYSKCQSKGPPTSCEGIDSFYLPHNETCTKYVWCVNSRPYTMDCPLKSFFIPGEDFNKCMYTYAPYLIEIPEDKYQACLIKEASRPPTTTTTRKP